MSDIAIGKLMTKVTYHTAAAFFFLVTVTIKRPFTAGIRWGSSLSCLSSSGSNRSLASGADMVCYEMEVVKRMLVFGDSRFKYAGVAQLKNDIWGEERHRHVNLDVGSTA